MIPEEEDGGLKQQLRLHATRLFAQRGFAGTSMRELVEACECTKAACYYYFSSKEALYRDVVEFHSQTMDSILMEAISTGGTVRERLHAGLEAMVEFCIENPVAMRLLQRIDLSQEENAPAFDDIASREKDFCLIMEMVAEGCTSGELRSDMEPEEGALVLAGAMHFQFDAAIASGEWNRERMHKTIDLVLDGIAKHD